MVIIAPLFLISISYLMGVLLKGLFCDDDGRVVRTCLIGTFFVVIVWEIYIQICGEILDDFTLACKVFNVIMVVFLLLSLFLNKKAIAAHFEVKNSVQLLPVILIFLGVMISVVCYISLEPDTVGDNSLETINTVQATNRIFDFEPLTGKAYTGSDPMPLTERIVTLPLFYAYITELFKAKADTVVFTAMPLWVLILTIFAYSVWADAFFESGDKVYRTMFFVCGIIILNLFGAFSQNSTYYYQTLKGFTGQTFCYSVLIPFAVYECFDGMRSKKWQSGIYILMAFACTIFVTKIQTGLVPFSIAVALAFIVSLGIQMGRYVWRR